MNKIKTYNEFTNEEINWKKAIAGAAITGALTSCEPADNKTMDQIHKDYSTEVNKNKPASMKDVSLPNQFKVDQDILSIGSDFHIKSGSNKCGVVEERVLSWGKTFEYLMNGQLVSRAEQRVLSWGIDIEVFDDKKVKIGEIEEEILEGMFSIKTIYSIKDSSGKVIGKSKKLDFFGTDIDIYNMNGDLIATMRRPMINLLSDSWKINIMDDKIDKRLLVFIPCYKTSADAEREEKDDD